MLATLLHVQAQNNESWQARGYVLAAPLRDMTLAGTRLFACSPEGIWVSTNYGNSWTRTYAGQWEQHNSTAAIGNTVFVTSENGLLRSTDGGVTWTTIPGSYGDYASYRRILALSTRLFRSPFQSSFGSTGSWEYSDDQGQTWTLLANVADLYVSNGVLLALNATGNVLRSTNLGATWTQLAPALGQPVVGLAIINQRVYAAAGTNIYTYQNGNGWNLRSTGLSGNTLTGLTAIGTTVYAAAEGSLHTQVYNASTWQLYTTGTVKKVLVSGNRRMFMTDGRVFNNSYPSIMPYNKGLGNSIISHLTVFTTYVNGDPRTQFIAANHNAYDEDMGSGMYQFAPVYEQVRPYLGQSNTSGIYTQALLAEGDDVFSYSFVWAAGCCQTLTRTLDGGQTVDYLWTEDYDPVPYALARIGTTLFAGVDGGVVIAPNNGDQITFQPCENTDSLGNCITNTGLDPYETVKVLYATGTSLLAGTATGVYVSQDMGQTFTSMGLSANVQEIMMLNGQVLVATTTGVYRAASLNTTTWTAINNGLPTGPAYDLVAVNASNLYVATGSGVYISNNTGTTWSPFNVGLTNLDVRTLATNGILLAAGTNGSGIFTRSLLPSSDNAPAATFSLTPAAEAGVLTLAAYPNPTTDQLLVELPAAGHLTLTTLDGRIVLEQAATGTEISLSLADYVPGHYLVTLQTAEGRYTVSVVLQ
ncbi:MAG: T9SS type A sorting domain-containing protein [Bacteroidia bacterium]|nr:T9SS type A sorting domain-containing protein [Bacteroidia bacterium]